MDSNVHLSNVYPESQGFHSTAGVRRHEHLPTQSLQMLSRERVISGTKGITEGLKEAATYASWSR